MKNIAIVGSGVVGASWCVVFARAGYAVKVFDRSSASITAAMDFSRGTLQSLGAMDLLRRQKPEEVLSRIKPVSTLRDAVGEADYVQESAPERLAAKQELYRELDSLIKDGAILASSTSGLPASSFTEPLKHRGRCIVAHPINPPHLIPLVEIVPAPWTETAVVEQTKALMLAVGQSPVCLNREIVGFVVNRLQGAMLNEAFRLVEQGVTSAAEVDAAMSDGLGLRWFFMGPFETIDLNAQGGVADYCEKLGPMYHEIALDQVSKGPWSKELIAQVEKQRRECTPAAKLDDRKRWRDRCLAAVIKAKQAVFVQVPS